ncbi:hypothetical protein FF36_02248 [Frankia torreyi]|uniref:Uncharacterized protein n=1 Tax=Frankia torreyi TaxID=1856 RepID=A0A0D8BJF3_9ACTN|nr:MULTISPECIES: DUF6153 family protein [Frankia]KJE23542.1 hypothetical protein FF36_02248 [Frankia torreyi]
MSARPHGKTTAAGLPLFLLAVPVLLGILLMHGGLSAHLAHGLHADTTDQIGSSVMYGADMYPPPSALPVSHPDPRHVMTPPATEMDHDGHGGAMCLAFLRLTLLLVIALLLTRLLSSTSVRRAVLRAASPHRGRAPPDRSLLHRPSLASLCVLRL